MKTLTRTGTKPSEFGRQAAGDPSLLLSLRRGRSPKLATADRILAFIRQQEQPRADRQLHIGYNLQQVR